MGGFSVHCVSAEEAEAMVSALLEVGEEGVASFANAELSSAGLPYSVEVTSMSAFVPSWEDQAESASDEGWLDEHDSGNYTSYAGVASVSARTGMLAPLVLMCVWRP